MMSRWSCGLCVLICIAGCWAESVTPASVPGYLKGMSALTKSRIPMKSVVVERCSIDAILSSNPHAKADMIVHGNRVLLDYVKANPNGTAFPVGSVLLKEKFPPGKGEASATLITRMERISTAGEVSDWRFTVRELGTSSGSVEKDPGGRCATCHEDFDESSFVSPKSVALLRAFVGKKE